MEPHHLLKSEMKPGSYAKLFYEPNLIRYIKYMKSSMPESIRNASFNMERLSRSSRLAQPGISTFNRLWNGFDFDAVFSHAHITYFESSWAEMSIFHLLNLVQLELRSASESIQPVKIIWVGLNNSNYKVRLMKSSGSDPGPIRKKKRHRNAFSLSRRVILQATMKPAHHHVFIKRFI